MNVLCDFETEIKSLDDVVQENLKKNENEENKTKENKPSSMQNLKINV